MKALYSSVVDEIVPASPECWKSCVTWKGAWVNVNMQPDAYFVSSHFHRFLHLKKIGIETRILHLKLSVSIVNKHLELGASVKVVIFNFQYWLSLSARILIKLGVNRLNGSKVIQLFRFTPSWILSIFHIRSTHRWISRRCFILNPHQIWWWSVERFKSYGTLSISEMAATAILNFFVQPYMCIQLFPNRVLSLSFKFHKTRCTWV